ncbi:ComEA family DNA-binding protein [Amantichitinum ursilacus]|uniref:ComE operon protein 1 n=1 Tax=Amantichitinum ursilacus TaxID=857265 RepID=A0A0N0GQJ5_9NEIS|nr:helix-hairpin-helix domain-containing protein [Amantichitinum ursilacus]KPC54521.1 ComE operon protein 1 [Amantichitinum ursilacus]
MKKWIIGFCSLFVLTASAWATVNLNTATQEQLTTLTGIGPGKAKAIIEYRKTTPFKSPEDITKVPGIKNATYVRIKNDIAVGGAPAPAPVAKPVKK